MTRRLFVLAMAISTFASAAAQSKKDAGDARLTVEDSAGMFSADGIKKAKATLGELKDRPRLDMTVVTFKDVPQSKADDFKKLDAEGRKKFFRDWAIAEAKAHKAYGVFVLICREADFVEVLTDRQTREKGFTARDEVLVRDMLTGRFREAKDRPEGEQPALRDKGLLAAVEFVHDAYLKMGR